MNTQRRTRSIAHVCLIAGALMLSAIPAWSGGPDDTALLRESCRQGDRGRLIRFDQVASFPTAADARARFYVIDLRLFDDLDQVNSWIQAMPRAIQWFRTLQ